MPLSKKYINQFYNVYKIILTKHNEESIFDIEIGLHMSCPFSPQIIMEVMDVWVGGIDKLIQLAQQTSKGRDSGFFSQLYEERGFSYDEYYYLFSDKLNEEDYLKTPAFIFTKTYNNDLRIRRFAGYQYSPESYKDFILSQKIEPTKLFLQRNKAAVPISSLFAHSYCVAKTRSGKTELLKVIIYNLILRKDPSTSLLLLDPHGEFAREIRRLKVLVDHKDDFVYLDPAMDGQHTPVFNPFELREKDTAKLAYATDTILDAFQQLLRDQIITGNMRRLLRHCIYCLLYHEGTTLMDLYTLLSGIGRNRNLKIPDFTEEENRLMEMGRTSGDPLTQKFFISGWREVDSRTITAVAERVDGILSHPIVRRFIVGKNSFDLEGYLNTGKIVVVNLDFTRLGNIGSEAIGRLIVSESQNISAKRSRIPKAQRPRTLIFMDECQRFVSAAIERALSEFGKFNTFLFLAHQYVEQIDDGMVKAMLSNTENKFVGRNSAATMSSLASDVGVSKEDLLEVKKYEFYLKAGDERPFLFKSSDKLLEHADNEHYLSEEEAQEQVDQYMISKYYRPINENTRAFAQNQVANHESSKLPVSSGIHLDSNDF